MLVAVLTLTLGLFAAQGPERIVDIRVQGNTITAEADIVRMAGVEPGTEITPQTIEAVEARVRAGGRFERVEVLKRFASIADPTQIVLIILVDEGRITVERQDGQPPRAVRRRFPPIMWLPLLGSEEGYGFTYGALATVQSPFGPGTRISFPVTWGGERRAGVELEKRATTGRVTRLRGAASVVSRHNPAYERNELWQQAWIRGDREIVRALRAGAWTGIDFVTFANRDDRIFRTGLDVTLDTRVDPMLSRQAVYVRTSVERLGMREGDSPLRTLVDAQAYVGGPWSTTIVVRAYRNGANRPLPPYMKVLLGRDSTLRGFPPGIEAGDTTAAGTIEVRWPITSPLRLGKLGLRAFVDAATVYDADERMADQHFGRSVGGGVWFYLTVIRLAFDVAHGSIGTTRAQVSTGLLF